MITEKDILASASMPLYGASYPKGPYYFIDREYMVITYETDSDAIEKILPSPLEPDKSNQVSYEFIKMPDSSGFGSYTETGIIIPALFKGMKVNYTAQMYLDSEAPIAAGREIWGFPKKYANPCLELIHDTLTGTLHYADQLVSVGTMGYKYENLIHEKTCEHDMHEILKKLGKTQVNLKLIPHVDGSAAIAQLVSYNMTDITLKGAWRGPARLHLIPHASAPLADLPVKRVIEGLHYIIDATLPYGEVLWDYLNEK